MAGVGYTRHLDETLRKGIYDEQIPNIKFLYEVSSTKSLESNVGDRVCLADGRAFRYGKAGTALNPQRAANNYNRYTVLANVGVLAVGQEYVDITLDATTEDDSWFGIKDNMAGGFWLQPDATNAQMRGIVHHEAGDLGDLIRVYLDAPITTEVANAAYTEWTQNPYSDLRGTADWSSCMGIPNVTFASGDYGWFQTWGPRFVAPNVIDVGSENAYSRRLVFLGGNVTNANDGASAQLAGFIMGRSAAGDWQVPPIVYLQLCP